MWQWDYKKSWVPNNWYFWTIVLEKTLESPLEYKEIQPVHSKGNQSWIFIGRTDAEAETLILLPLDVKNWSLAKTLMLGKIESERRRGWQRMRGWMASPTQWTRVCVNSGSWWWKTEAWHAAVHGVTKGRTWLSDWTELNWLCSWVAFQIHINPFCFPLVNFLHILLNFLSYIWIFALLVWEIPWRKDPVGQ